MKRLIFILLFALFLFPLTNAYQKEIPLNVIVGCDKINCSLDWNITILNPNSSVLINNKAMSVGNYYSNYSLTPMDIGTYSVFLSDTTGSDSYGTSFEVTYIAESLTTAQGVLYGSFIILLILFVIGLLVLYSSLPNDNPRSAEGKILSINRLKYLRMPLLIFSYFMVAFIFYIASNLGYAFLSETLVAQVFFFLFRSMMILSPVIIIVWFIGIFFSVFEDKEIRKMMYCQGINVENNRSWGR